MRKRNVKITVRTTESEKRKIEALAKSLAEEGYIESGGGENTRAMRFCGKQKRVMLLRKSAVGKVQG